MMFFFHGKLRQVESRERPITEGARVVLPLFRPVPQQVQRLGSALPEHYRLAVFHDVSPFKKNECGIWLLALSNFVMLKKTPSGLGAFYMINIFPEKEKSSAEIRLI